MTTAGEMTGEAADGETPDAGAELVDGYGSSPGVATGPVEIIEDIDEADRIDEGDVIVTEMTAPDMVPAMKRSAGIITDEGGMTSHAAIVSRELGVPAIVGTGDATAWTQGCVAVPNPAMDRLWSLVRVGTPVLVE
jgi:pyruvate,water dikinase